MPSSEAPQPLRPRVVQKRVSPWQLRAPMDAASGRLLGVVSLGCVLALWCLVSYVQVTRNGERQALIPSAFLPAPHEVVKSFVFLVLDPNVNLFSGILVSLIRIAKAFALTIGVAFPLGVAMGAFEPVRRVFDPIIAPLRYLPITAFTPLMILWFGIDEAQKIFFLFLGTVVYLLPAVVDAIRAVPEELVQTAYTLGATKAQVIRTVLVPAAMPQIFDGFRVINAIAWTYIILAEATNAKGGIGYILGLAASHLKTEWNFAGLIVVGLIGILTDFAIRGLNSLLFSWREST
jgi:NitT/TauT family transport system permease protein